jgi:cullin 3
MKNDRMRDTNWSQE